MSRVIILPTYEAKQFDQPPKFSQAERHYFFAKDRLVEMALQKVRGEKNWLGWLLQYGYFKASGKFYAAEKFWQQDIKFIAKQLNVIPIRNFADQYAERTRLNHKLNILTQHGHQPFSANKVLFSELTEDLVAKQLSPRKIVLSLVDMLREKKIEVPQYDTFSRTISDTINRYEQQNQNKLSPLLTPPYQQILLSLLDKVKADYQRPLLVGLKTISQSIRPSQIKRSLQGFLMIKKLYEENGRATSVLILAIRGQNRLANARLCLPQPSSSAHRSGTHICARLRSGLQMTLRRYRFCFLAFQPTHLKALRQTVGSKSAPTADYGPRLRLHGPQR